LIHKLFHSPIFNSWFSAFVGLFGSIIAIPIVITKLSVEEINIWLLFASILAISQGVQFGFNTTFARFIAYVNSGVKIGEFRNLRFKKDTQYENEVNKSEFSRVFHLMKYVYVFLSIIYFIVLLLIGYFSLITPISSLPTPSDGWIAASVVTVSTTITLFLGYYQNFMLGINKVALVQRITGIVNLIGLVFILSVLFLNPTLLSIVLIYQVVSLCVLFTIVYFSKKEIRKMNIEKTKNSFDKELFSIVWESAWKSGITTVIANVVKHISVILVAQFFSPAVSASFLFTKRIFDIIENFTMTTFQARIPIIAKYRGQGNFEKLIPLLRQTQYISYGVYLVGYIVLLVTGEYILSLIGSNVNLGSYSLIVLFSFATFMSRWGGMSLSISNQSNHVVEHINAIVVAVVFFTVVFIFYKTLGIEVFPFAQTISMIAVSPFIIKLVYKNLHTTFWQYEKKVFIPLFGILILINSIYYWSNI
jgi:O-antigen/teichoic acid export membrane protein